MGLFKTARAPQLEAAAPGVWAEMNAEDAALRGLAEGERVRIGSPRGSIEAPLRVTQIRRGLVFVPFHYGYWDQKRPAPNGAPRAANELTLTAWDPVSKQPLFKVAAVEVSPA